jgi:hypothetical protein
MTTAATEQDVIPNTEAVPERVQLVAKKRGLSE